MFDLYSGFWNGRRSLDFFCRHADFRYAVPQAATPADLGLSAPYAAVDLSTGTAVADTPGNRALLGEVRERLAARMPVVVLDETTPGDAVAVIAGARHFVGTCGGLACLAPFLGVDTIALYDDEDEMSTHLYAARYAYRKSGAAPFSVLNTGMLRAADRALDTTP